MGNEESVPRDDNHDTTADSDEYQLDGLVPLQPSNVATRQRARSASFDDDDMLSPRPSRSYSGDSEDDDDDMIKQSTSYDRKLQAERQALSLSQHHYSRQSSSSTSYNPLRANFVGAADPPVQARYKKKNH